MFTGIIEEVGSIAGISDRRDFRTIQVAGMSIFDDLKIGSSIAVNGVCLTARSVADRTFSAELSRETLDRTSLGRLQQGSIVESRTSDARGSRFGGHIVQGHVDWRRAHRRVSSEKAMRGICEVEYPESAAATSSKRALLQWTASA